MEKFDTIHEDATLMKKVLLKEADAMEQQEFEKKLAENLELQKVYEQLQHSATLKSTFDEYHNYSSDKAYQSFLQVTGPLGTKAHPQKRLQLGWYSIAAAVVLAVGLSFYTLNGNLSGEIKEMSKVLIQPGTKQAQLALPDGNIIDVNKQKEVNVVVDGVRVQYKKGVLSYQPTERTLQRQDTNEETVIHSNELIIPRGGENTVVLADGTTVHLNAGSKLIYPVRFIGKRRIVTLEGEGYFDVTKDAEHPFVVQTNLGEVTVLGTAFNVNAYPGSSACYTTLVQGKVRLVTPNGKEITLQPGEQAVVSTSGIEKHPVDVDEYIGWVNGSYTFNDRSLGEIMKTFERWYDIQVYFQTPALRNITYSGSLKRYKTINSFLDALELTGDLTYEVNGRNVLIYDKTREKEQE